MTIIESPVPGSEKPVDNSIPSNLGNDFNPTNEAVFEKPYAKPNILPTSEQLAQPIPSPDFSIPQSTGNVDAYSEISGNNRGGGGGGGGQQKQQAPPPPPPVNPAMQNASDEEKKMGAKQLAKVIMDGYEWGHQIANEQLKFSEKRITKLVADGEIDIQVPIPYDMDKVIKAADFIRDHNELVQNALEVTPKFKKEVTPVLERVLEKRGAGLTDEQTLIYMFGRDIAIKSVQFFGIKRNQKDMIDIMKQYTEILREQGRSVRGAAVSSYTPPPPPPPQGGQPVYATQPVYQEPEETTGNGSPMAPYEGNVPGAPEFGNKDTLSTMDAIKKNEKAKNYFNKKPGRNRNNKIEYATVIGDDTNPLD